MERRTFKHWLSERVGDGPGQVSRRELARRLAARHPGAGGEETVESHRRNLRKILKGETAHPTQPTRDAIQDALDDHTAPTAEEDAADSPITRDEFRVWQRTNAKLARGLAVQT